MGYGHGGGYDSAGCGGFLNPYSPSFIIFLVLILLFFGGFGYGGYGSYEK
ncbi:hypothetical protein [Desulforamulus reducens]|nr:hypothetical protein [Desulforamulus reducens]